MGYRDDEPKGFFAVLGEKIGFLIFAIVVFLILLGLFFGVDNSLPQQYLYP